MFMLLVRKQHQQNENPILSTTAALRRFAAHATGVEWTS